MRILIYFLLITPLACASEERVSELASEIEFPRPDTDCVQGEKSPQDLSEFAHLEQEGGHYVYYDIYQLEWVDPCPVCLTVSFPLPPSFEIAIRVELVDGKPRTLYVRDMDVKSNPTCYGLKLDEVESDSRKEAFEPFEAFGGQCKMQKYYEGKNKKEQVFRLKWDDELKVISGGSFSGSSDYSITQLPISRGQGIHSPSTYSKQPVLDDIKELFASCMGKK